MNRALALALLAACGSDPAAPDAAVDSTVARCSPTGTFGAPVPVGGLNSELDDVSARFSPDELTVTFSRRLTSGVYDLYTATRTQRDGAFSDPMLLPTVNSVNSDVWPTPAPSGLLLLFDSDRSTGIYHIYISKRGTLSDTFGPGISAVALMDLDMHPMLANGRALYFASNKRAGLGLRDIFRAEIDTTGATSAPEPLVGGVNSADDDMTPAVTDDELRIFFRRSIGTESDVYTASRSTMQDGFGTATTVDGLAVAGVRETPTWVSPDGCALYFSSNVTTGMGGEDLYVVYRGN